MDAAQSETAAGATIGRALPAPSSQVLSGDRNDAK